MRTPVLLYFDGRAACHPVAGFKLRKTGSDMGDEIACIVSEFDKGKDLEFLGLGIDTRC